MTSWGQETEDQPEVLMIFVNWNLTFDIRGGFSSSTLYMKKPWTECTQKCTCIDMKLYIILFIWQVPLPPPLHYSLPWGQKSTLCLTRTVRLGLGIGFFLYPFSTQKGVSVSMKSSMKVSVRVKAKTWAPAKEKQQSQKDSHPFSDIWLQWKVAAELFHVSRRKLKVY